MDFTPPPRLKTSESRMIYSVSDINRDIRMLLEGRFANIWVEGEISNLKKHTSGHYYLSLKDDKAQISAVCFSRYNSALKFDVKDGLKVVVFGKISLYEPRGQYQLYIERMEPKGIGALQLAFLQLREKLQQEGLFDAERKKRIPKFPKCVGIVTSPTGAAIRDILNVMTRRFAGTEILIYPVQVQGASAAPQIARAIHDLNQRGGLDVLIVGRGGGSLEDLWAFNEEIVARAIFNSQIPIISAVGHEIDWTIADYVADLRAPTPSAAAELVVQNRADLERRLKELEFRLVGQMRGFLEDRRQHFTDLTQSYAFKQPQVLIQQCTQRMDEMLRQMHNYAKSLIIHKRQSFHMIAGRLSALSPLAILDRGYSLTFDGKNGLIKSAKQVKKGDTIETRLHEGTIVSQVTETKTL